MSILWDERADWWPLFHFRSDLVPKKDHVSELEWKLTRHKAEAARWLLGEGAALFFLASARKCVRVFVKAVFHILYSVFWIIFWKIKFRRRSTILKLIKGESL